MVSKCSSFEGGRIARDTAWAGILGIGMGLLGASGIPLAIWLCERQVCKEDPKLQDEYRGSGSVSCVLFSSSS